MAEPLFKDLSKPKAFNDEVDKLGKLAHEALKDQTKLKAFVAELNNLEPRKDLPKVLGQVKDIASKFNSNANDPQEILIADDPYKNIGLNLAATANEKPLAIKYVKNHGWEAAPVEKPNELRASLLAEKYPDQKQHLSNVQQGVEQSLEALNPFKKHEK